MRIVTGNARDARVGSVEALTIRQAVGLEAHVNNSPRVISNHRLPCAMALSAEVRNILRGQHLESAGRCFKHALQRVELVRDRSRMTMLAGYALLQRLKCQLALRYRIGRMACEAIFGISGRQFSASGLFQCVRGEAFISEGCLQCADRRVVADQAFVVGPPPFEYPRLHSLAYGPANGNRDRLGAVGNAIGAVMTVGLYRVNVRAFAD